MGSKFVIILENWQFFNKKVIFFINIPYIVSVNILFFYYNYYHGYKNIKWLKK